MKKKELKKMSFDIIVISIMLVSLIDLTRRSVLKISASIIIPDYLIFAFTIMGILIFIFFMIKMFMDLKSMVAPLNIKKKIKAYLISLYFLSLGSFFTAFILFYFSFINGFKLFTFILGVIWLLASIYLFGFTAYSYFKIPLKEEV